MVLLKGFLLVLGGIIALVSIKLGKLPRGIVEWLIWGLDIYIIVTEVL